MITRQRQPAAAGRDQDLSISDLDTAEHAWGQYWAAVRPVELTAAVERHAGQLARTYALRGADAVHLASALALADPELIAVWDKRLHAGAASAQLHVAPAHPCLPSQLAADSEPANSICRRPP